MALRMIKKVSKKFMQGSQGGQRGAFSKAFSVLPHANDDEKLIEVFDVLIKTQNRLVIRDGQTREDRHCSAEYIDLAESFLNRANYTHRMEKESADAE